MNEMCEILNISNQPEGASQSWLGKELSDVAGINIARLHSLLKLKTKRFLITT